MSIESIKDWVVAVLQIIYIVVNIILQLLLIFLVGLILAGA